MTAEHFSSKLDLLPTKHDRDAEEHWPQVVARSTDGAPPGPYKNNDAWAKLIFSRTASSSKLGLLLTSLLYGTTQKLHSIRQFPWKWAIWQNHDQEKNKQKVKVYLKTTLPNNKQVFY